jgi:hypothetical protein
MLEFGQALPTERGAESARVDNESHDRRASTLEVVQEMQSSNVGDQAT